MSLKTTRKGQSFESTGRGATSVTRLPIGLSFERILVPFSGVTLAEMTEARIIANGETIRTFRDLTKLDVINQFDGMQAVDGILVFNFVRHGLRTRSGEEFTKLGTGAPRSETNPNPITTLALEIDVSASAVEVPVFGIPKLHQDLPSATGAILKTKQYNYSPTGGGIFEIADLPKGELVNRIFFFTPNNLIKSLEVERDNFVSFSRSTAENELLQREGFRVPQTGVWVYDPTENGNGSEGLPTANVHDLRFRLDMVSAETIEVVVETISTLQA
jgi:hypothetical protein